ncbi:MAG: mechanosensitive ion channel [Desulfobulbaceae bacterium]|nr:mechanosensitive ion channel [Desulfobulbaceae bacterium]
MPLTYFLTIFGRLPYSETGFSPDSVAKSDGVVSSKVLGGEEMENMMQTVWMWLGMYAVKLAVAILIFVVGRWFSHRVAALLVKVLEHRQVEVTLVSFLRNIVYYALLVAVIIAAVNQLGINTASFLAVIGAAGLAVGLALKDSLANFSAGVMLILFRPFKVGDFVVAGGVSGTVTEVSIFNTEMATPDNQKVMVPNSAVMGNVITNVTANPTRRIDLTVGIGYGDDMARAKEVLTAIVGADSRILKEPEPVVAVAELGENGVNLVVRPWVMTNDYWQVRFDLTERIKSEFDGAGLHIPFPQREVHLHMERGEAQSVSAS